MSVNITKEAIMDNISEIPEEFVVEAEYTEEELKRLEAAADKKAAVAAALVSETPDKKTGHLPDPFMTEADAEDDEPEMKPVATPKRKGGAILWGVTGITLAAAAILLFVFLWNPERHDVVTTTEAATTAAATEAPTEEATEATTEVTVEDTTEATAEATTEEVTTEEATTVAIPDIAKGEPVELNEVYFPDPLFREYIRELADTDRDSVLSETEYRKVTELDINVEDLTSLKGVEFFPELTKLCCERQALIGLDVSKNTKLRELRCSQNLHMETLVLGDINGLTILDCTNCGLKSLDVSKLVDVEQLYCDWNSFSELDLSNCEKLNKLVCSNDKLTKLDVSTCKMLKELYCDANKLTELDISKNTLLEVLSCYGNPLKVLDVRNNPLLVQINNNPNTEMIYNETLEPNGEGGLPIDEEHFPHGVFRNTIRNQFDTDRDGYLTEEELKVITNIDVSSTGIRSLQGIEYFTELESLDCSSDKLTELDLSKNPKLMFVYCAYNELTELNTSHNSELVSLNCAGNQLTKLDLSQNRILRDLYCESNRLKELDVSHNSSLVELNVGWNRISKLDLSKNYILSNLDAMNMNLTELDVSCNEYLASLSCYGNKITKLDVRENMNLNYVVVDESVDVIGAVQSMTIYRTNSN